jgi:hypothetical protein
MYRQMVEYCLLYFYWDAITHFVQECQDARSARLHQFATTYVLCDFVWSGGLHHRDTSKLLQLKPKKCDIQPSSRRVYLYLLGCTIEVTSKLLQAKQRGSQLPSLHCVHRSDGVHHGQARRAVTGATAAH